MTEEEIRSVFLSLFKNLLDCGEPTCEHLAGHFRFSTGPTTENPEKGVLEQGEGELFSGGGRKLPRLKFRPRSLDEAVEFFRTTALRGNPEAWFEFWESRDWKDAAGPIRNWKARARHYSTTDIALRDEDALKKRPAKAEPSAPVAKLKRPAPGIPVWSDAAGYMRLKIDPKLFDTWFRPVEQLEYRDDGVLVLLIPSDGFRWAFDHYGQRIQEAARASAGRTVTIKLHLASEYEPR